MPLPNLDEVIRTYLYGANFLPSSFVDPSLMRSEVETASITGVSSEEFMAGPGRFAVANLFEAVDQFFGTTSGYDVSQLFAGVTGSEVRMSKQAWCQGILGLTTNSLSIDQKDF